MLTALAFLTGFAGLLVLAVVRHPIFGLYAYLASFYVHPPSRWWGQLLPDLRWALLAAAVTAAALIVHRGRLRPDHPAWPTSLPAVLLAAFVLWLWVQNAWALDSRLHLDATIQYTKYLLVFYFVYRLAETPERMRGILFVHVLGCAYLALLARYADNYVDGRLNGVGGPGIDDANSLGMFLGTGVAVAGTLALAERGWRRAVAVVAGAIILNGLILTASRGAFLGVLAAALVALLLKPRQYRKLFWVFAAVGAIGAVSLMDQRFIDRMSSITTAVERTEEIDDSAESRWALKEAQLRMFAAHPFGAGHKGTAVLSPQYLDRKWLTFRAGEDESQAARASHNTFLTLLVEQGVFGALFYLLLVLWGFRAGLQLKRASGISADPRPVAYGLASLSALAVVLVAGQFTDYLMAEVQIWMAAILVASLRALALPARAEVAQVASAVLRA
jgi:O-antigen ligase